ncbi:MAG: hypothetical protein GX576_06475 [Thauera phenolivorans]|uniref:Uncharacterized protein n=1 Tax=Thauera phenolivorans TaxID=1792543 RepID=A0A7X7R7Z0_9RHOO|nr:hypothetical protein [Thauera phenolivorans]NLF54029.1 hypothetical protein [Thauera phenolivorans]
MSNNKTRSALRAGLQQEDAAVAERLPEVAQGGAPAPEANASPARKPAAKRAAATKAKPVEARPAAAAAEKAEVAKAAPAKDGAAGAPAAKPARRRAAPKAAVPVIEAVVAEAAAAKAELEAARKDKREKVVRDSFSLPKREHALIKTLRTRLATSGRLASKSEVLRAGLVLLAERTGDELALLVESLAVVPKGKGKK